MFFNETIQEKKNKYVTLFQTVQTELEKLETSFYKLADLKSAVNSIVAKSE